MNRIGFVLKVRPDLLGRSMAAEPVNERWQALMAPYFTGSGRHADQMMESLEAVFHLD